MERTEKKHTYIPDPSSDSPSLIPTEPAPIPLDPIQEEGATYHTEKNELKGPDGTAKITATPKFYCPMHCEGDRTYDQPGNCPVCGMALVEARD